MKSRNRGFSLIEVVTVVTIIGLLATTITPPLKRFYSHMQLKIATLILVKDIEMIQQRAITQGLSWRLIFNAKDNGQYLVAQSSSAKRVHLPPGTVIQRNSFDANELIFGSNGAPEKGGHITITNGVKTLYIIISVATGRVRISENPP